MTKIKLDYPLNIEGNYILKEVEAEEDTTGFFITTGTFNENLVIGNKFFNKKLKHKLEDIVSSIEESVMLENKIVQQDIVSESFILDVKHEEEFNPMFRNMTEKEFVEYTKDSTKVRISINFSICFRTKPHLWVKYFVETLRKIKW